MSTPGKTKLTTNADRALLRHCKMKGRFYGPQHVKFHDNTIGKRLDKNGVFGRFTRRKPLGFGL